MEEYSNALNDAESSLGWNQMNVKARIRKAMAEEATEKWEEVESKIFTLNFLCFVLNIYIYNGLYLLEFERLRVVMCANIHNNNTSQSCK